MNEKQLTIAGLPPALDGLSIAHFSDLHLTGRLSAAFYQSVIHQVNSLECELIALTGDILDKPQYLAWIDDLLSPLSAPLGAYVVLGNHDKKLKITKEICQCLEGAGLVPLGGKSIVRQMRGCQVLLAGNELPWIGSEPKNLAADVDLRIALLHTPDQIDWARRERFHLVLAGHTHGGQVRIPGIGAILSPSRYGTRYAGGVFLEPPCVMHVSRGVGGFYPLRLNCPPEITRVVLRRGTGQT